MPNSYVEYTYPNTDGGSSNAFKVYTPSGGIDGYIDPDFLEVYVNNVKIDYDSPSKFGEPYWTLGAPSPSLGLQFFFINNPQNIAPGSSIRMQRVTPSKLATFRDNVLEFFNTEVLNADQLNLALKAMIHLVQEAKEQAALPTSGGQYLPKDTTNPTTPFWTAQGTDLRNLPATPPTATSAASKGWVETAIAAAGSGGGGGGGGGGPWGTNDLIDNAVTTAKIAPEAVETSRLADNAVTTQKLLDDAVTTAKIEDDAITDDKVREVNVVLFPGYNGINGSKIASGTLPASRIESAPALNPPAGSLIPTSVLPRPAAANVQNMIYSTSVGSTLFPVTTYGRGLLNTADAAGLRTLLGLGTLSGLDSITNSNIVANAAISLSKLQTIPASTLVGNTGTSAATPSTVAINSFTLNSWGAPTASLSMNNQRIIQAATPIDPQDLATKGYVDSTTSAWPGVYNGTDEANATYPIGTTVLVIEEGGTPTAKAANSVQNVRYQTTNNTFYFGTAASGSVALAGTWRARGSFIVTVTLTTYGIHLVQRTA
jgi:hypothetical protein